MLLLRSGAVVTGLHLRGGRFSVRVKGPLQADHRLIRPDRPHLDLDGDGLPVGDLEPYFPREYLFPVRRGGREPDIADERCIEVGTPLHLCRHLLARHLRGGVELDLHVRGIDHHVDRVGAVHRFGDLAFLGHDLCPNFYLVHAVEGNGCLSVRRLFRLEGDCWRRLPPHVVALFHGDPEVQPCTEEHFVLQPLDQDRRLVDRNRDAPLCGLPLPVLYLHPHAPAGGARHEPRRRAVTLRRLGPGKPVDRRAALCDRIHVYRLSRGHIGAIRDEHDAQFFLHRRALVLALRVFADHPAVDLDPLGS